MTNAKEEFLYHVEHIESDILAADIYKDYNYGEKADTIAQLTVGFSQEDYDNFLTKLDFTYDSGFGGQHLFGTIWYEDGTWSSRGEYDGSEWRKYNFVPDIPEELL